MTMQERRLSFALLVFAFVIVVLVLGGCATKAPLQTRTTTPVCNALIGPIEYNSQKPESRRFAGPDLAPDLKQRNQVGEQLHCPKYR